MVFFSNQQLKTPRYMRDVYLVTGGNGEFRRAI